MKNYLATFLVITFLAIGLPVKDLAQSNKSSQPRLDVTRPTVYLSFEDVAKDSNTATEVIRLRFHNNTRFSIYFNILPEKPISGDLRISYDIESEPGYPPINLNKGDIFIGNKLNKGESKTFTVPLTHLSKGYSVYVKFNYDWETPANKISFISEPQHRAYIHYYQIPKR